MEILFDLVIILSISAISLYVSSRLNLPSILAFLVAGVLVGPHGVELISTISEVNAMAEIGILLLLFSIGIEFSLEKLMRSKLYVLVGGGVQVLLSILVFTALAMALGLERNQAIFVGMLLAMSSTAIVLQLFQEKGWMNTVFGNNSVSILIFQDIIIIPMMLVSPFLGGGEQDMSAFQNILIGFVMVGFVVFAARKFVPPILRNIVHTGNTELFLLSVIVICFSTAFITNVLGLKLALGAFLAGLIISESEYSFEALKNVMPFKKVFTAIFFISIGMLLNLNFLAENFGLVLLFTVFIMVVKSVIILGISLALRIGMRNAIVSCLVLCQVGEFAFILSKVGMDLQLLTEFANQMFLSISILSMIVSAILISSAPKLANSFVQKFPWKNWLSKLDAASCLPPPCTLTDHTVIIGYGPGGKRVASHLRNRNVPLAIIELNERNIHDEDYEKSQIFIGSGEDNDVLQRAAVGSAKQVIVTVPDPAAAEAITIKARKLNHQSRIIVRTKYQQETERLQKLGADHVVPEEISVAETITGALAV